MNYNVFHRTWWSRGPNGRVPSAGRKTYIARGVTEAQARDICRTWNLNHDPGPLSRKAEYERR